MSNLLDYLKWRGDIGFDESPFNEVDAILLCQLEYNKLKNAIPADFPKDAPTLKQVKKDFFGLSDIEERKHVGAMINPLTVELLEKAAESERFGGLLVQGYNERLDYDREEQFGAVTFSFRSKKQKWNCVVYRGTDDTILGWKEDFNLSFQENVPSQLDGLEYLNRAARNLQGSFMTAGHSKGGNLSMYASSHAENNIKKRITDVYNFDGPGFNPEFFSSPLYASVQNKEHSYVPSDSLVGMLFNHSDSYITVKSDQKNGITQHDPFSWQVEGKHFIELTDITESSRKLGNTINEWMYSIPVDQREAFIETVFGVLNAPEAKTSTEFSENMAGNVMKVVGAANKLDSQSKSLVMKTVNELLKYGKENFSENHVWNTWKRSLEEQQQKLGEGWKKLTNKL